MGRLARLEYGGAQSEDGSRRVSHAASHRRVATGVEAVACPVEDLGEQVPDLQSPHREAFTRGLHSLDEVVLGTIFRSRPTTMRSVPTFLKGAFRRALVLAMDEALEGLAALDEPRQERAWNSACCCPACSFTVPPEVVWLRRPNSSNVLHNLLQVSGTVCWRRVSEVLRRGPIWPDGNADENRMSS